MDLILYQVQCMQKERSLFREPFDPPFPKPGNERFVEQSGPLDKELFIRQTFADDPKKGIELLFREYYVPLCSHAVRYVYSKEIARDLVSDIFCNFFQKQHYKRVQTSYRAYLYSCVRNDSLKFIQRGSHSKTEDTADDPEDAIWTCVQTPEEILSFEELYNKIETVIKELSPQSRKVFVMSRYEGKKYLEISHELDISLKTVEAHMSKALSTLRKALRVDGLSLLLVSLIS
jgi:RNA polymerase sigma-70 factor (family 1)